MQTLDTLNLDPQYPALFLCAMGKDKRTGGQKRKHREERGESDDDDSSSDGEALPPSIKGGYPFESTTKDEAGDGKGCEAVARDKR